MNPWLLAALLAALAPAPASAQARAELEALAAGPGTAPAAFDGGGSSADAGTAAAAETRTPALPKPVPYDPRSHEPAATGPKTPSERSAWNSGKAWGGVIGGLIGALGGAPAVHAIWIAGIPWLGLLVGAALVAAGVAIGMDVGKHYALDEHRGNLE